MRAQQCLGLTVIREDGTDRSKSSESNSISDPIAEAQLCFVRTVGTSLLRPFARRRLSTLRPPVVDMRARKP